MTDKPYVIMPIGLLLKTWAGLMALLGLTYLLAHLDLGPFSLPAALAVAFAKAGLVLYFFMELKDGSPLVNVFAGTGFFWLAILLILGLSDYLARGVMLSK